MRTFLERAKAASIVALIKPNENYQWYVWKGTDRPMESKHGIKHTLKKGERFGMRPSSNGKFIRLIFEELGTTKVFTLGEGESMELVKKSKVEQN